VTVPENSNTRTDAVGNGIAKAFAFDFLCIEARDLGVYVAGVLVAPSQYAISGLGQMQGGTVTFITAPASGVAILMQLEVVAARATDYQNYGDLFAGTVNLDFDRLWLAIKTAYTSLTRALVLGADDVDGAGAYRAKGNRIEGLGVPLEMNDAARKQDIVEALADLSTDGTGQFVVERLADAGNPTNGANMVGYQPATGPATTVHLALRGAEADIDTLQTEMAAAKVDILAASREDLSPQMIDMHFGTLRGVGWGSAEVAGQVVTVTATAPAAAGAILLSVSNGSQLKVDQLICYVATNGLYYPAVIKTISGNNLTLKDPLEAPIAVGGEVHNFYANDAHPNQFGYNTIVDDALRRLDYREQLYTVKRDYQAWTAVGAATVAADTTFSYENPGISEVANRSVKVTAPGVGDGTKSPPVALPGGTYRYSVAVNLGQRVGNFAGGVLLTLTETTSNGEQYGIATQTVTGFNGIRLLQGGFTVRPGSTVSISLTSPYSGGMTFNVGRLAYYRLVGRLGSLDRGKHVLFGDSWFANGLMMQRFQQRLPKAVFVNKGVSGNKITDLVARFGTDVAPENPDFVWFMCGTNDIYAGITATAFEAELNTLKTNFAAIGAQPLFFNCSVGSAFYPIAPGEQLTNSRRYAIRVNYLNQAAQIAGTGSDVRSFSIVATMAVPAGSSVVLGGVPEYTRSTATLRNLFSVATAGMSLRVGYATTLSTTLTDEKVIPSGTAVADVLLNRTNSDSRIVNIVASNGTGAAQTIAVTAEVSWAKD
jgi:hypothetical protein